MRDEWILDVLDDLKIYAKNNGLRVLAEQLDDTRLVAAADLATRQSKGTALTGRVNAASAGIIDRAPRARDHA